MLLKNDHKIIFIQLSFFIILYSLATTGFAQQSNQWTLPEYINYNPFLITSRYGHSSLSDLYPFNTFYPLTWSPWNSFGNNSWNYIWENPWGSTWNNFWNISWSNPWSNNWNNSWNNSLSLNQLQKQTENIDLNIDDDGTSITLKKGDTLSITLPSNERFRWLSGKPFDVNVIIQKNSQYLPKGIINHSYMQWFFEAIGIGTTTIKFYRTVPADPNTFELQVIVED